MKKINCNKGNKMNLQEAKTKTAEWEKVEEKELMKTGEDNEAYHFLYKKNGEYFKVAIDKKSNDFYSMSDTISKNEIENYEANNLAS